MHGANGAWGMWAWSSGAGVILEMDCQGLESRHDDWENRLIIDVLV